MWKIGGLLTLCCLPLLGTLSDRVEELEAQMKEVGKLNAKGKFGAEMRAAQPEVKKGRFFFTGEILYWDTKLGGTDYVLTVAEPKSTPAPPIKGSIKSNSFGWDFGGRLGLGMNLPHDGWDLYLNFTYYENHDTDACFKNPPSILLSEVGFFGGIYQQAKSTFDLTYLNLDLEMGREFFISKRLSLKMHWGLKGTRLLQEHKVKSIFSPFQPDQIFGEFYRVYNRCDFNGIGPRVGFQGNWFLGYGFRLMHEMAASLLYCYFDVVEKEKTSPNTSTQDVDIRLKGKMGRFIPFAQMFLGLGWGDYFNDEKFYLTLKVGYEVLYFWRENQCLEADDWNFSPLLNVRLNYKRFAEDLSFYGITFRMRLDF